MLNIYESDLALLWTVALLCLRFAVVQLIIIRTSVAVNASFQQQFFDF